MSGDEDDMDGDIILADPTWEDLDHSHAGGDFKVFHDLNQEMHVFTGR